MWIASVAVLAFALAPYYIGHVASALSRRPVVTTISATKQSATASNQETSSQAALETVTVKVEGMSCTACEVPVRDALDHTPGVRAVDVSYQRGDAQVKYDPKQIGVAQIKRAIDSTGYKAK